MGSNKPFFRVAEPKVPENNPNRVTISLQQAQERSRKLATKIFNDWKLLRFLYTRQGPQIHKRWLKHSKKQRREILLAAWPNMPAVHRPDLAAFNTPDEDWYTASTQCRDAYMRPYINLEDLSKPKNLLYFLQARASNRLWTFAISDLDAAELGFRRKAIGLLSVDVPSVMNVRFETSASPYGKIYSFDENPLAEECFKNGRGIDPADGFVILEIQQGTIGGLVNCCKHIMHDVSIKQLISRLSPIQPQVTLASDTVDGFESLAVIAAESPYRRSNWDFSRIEALIAAKRSAAEDHVWALREDPGYFANALLVIQEHSYQMIKGKHGPVEPLPNTDYHWLWIIINVLSRAYQQLDIWSLLHAQARELLCYEEKFTPDPRWKGIRGNISEEHFRALVTFHDYLRYAATEMALDCTRLAESSPPLRRFFVVEQTWHDDYEEIQVMNLPSVGLDKHQQEFLWLLDVLKNNNYVLGTLGLPLVIDELERLTQREQKVKELTSSCVADFISELAIMTGIIRQLHDYQSGRRLMGRVSSEFRATTDQNFTGATRGWMHLEDGLTDLPDTYGKKLGILGKPVGLKFHYPVDKRRTKENVRAMRSAEKNLDAFWSFADEKIHIIMEGEMERASNWQLLSQSRVLQRTPEWVEPDKQTSLKQPPQVPIITKSLADIHLDLELRTESTIDHSSHTRKLPSVKPKTRGISAPAPPADEDFGIDELPEIRPTFHVDARALKVFRTLFYTPTVNGTPGEVPWKDFVHAMVAAGFVPVNLSSSVWQFTPTTLSVKRGIHFHQPHPSTKYSYKIARNIGSRLNRAYGFEGDMFQPKKL